MLPRELSPFPEVTGLLGKGVLHSGPSEVRGPASPTSAPCPWFRLRGGKTQGGEQRSGDKSVKAKATVRA